MNMKMRGKMNKSRKALSPVVASIILIAVTIAVSIAVAAWMGALTFNFTATEQLKITNLRFGTAQTMMNVTMLNSGANAVTITEVHVNNGPNLISTASPAWNGVIKANGNATETFTFTWTSGYLYEIELRSSKGNEFTYSATAPS
jgi:flagellin-like protein